MIENYKVPEYQHIYHVKLGKKLVKHANQINTNIIYRYLYVYILCTYTYTYICMYVKQRAVAFCWKVDDGDFSLHRGITVGGICEHGASGDVTLKVVIEGKKQRKAMTDVRLDDPGMLG